MSTVTGAEWHRRQTAGRKFQKSSADGRLIGCRAPALTTNLHFVSGRLVSTAPRFDLASGSHTQRGVTDVESYTSQTAVLPVLRVCTPAAKLAHPSKVGFLAVQGDAIGGSLLESRSITFDVRIQPTNAANGISGSAAQGSPMAAVAVPAETKARGVPPRGRPV